MVPQVSLDPRFLHRAASRGQREEEVTFICVPITLDGGTVGTLAIEEPYRSGHVAQRTVHALRIGLHITAGADLLLDRIDRSIQRRAAA